MQIMHMQSERSHWSLLSQRICQGSSIAGIRSAYFLSKNDNLEGDLIATWPNQQCCWNVTPHAHLATLYRRRVFTTLAYLFNLYSRESSEHSLFSSRSLFTLSSTADIISSREHLQHHSRLIAMLEESLSKTVSKQFRRSSPPH